MNSIVADVEDMLVKFVRSRVPDHEWRHISTEADVLNHLSYDDENEIKDFVWREVQFVLNWSSVLREIKEMSLLSVDTNAGESDSD